jgi:hypothetical protein
MTTKYVRYNKSTLKRFGQLEDSELPIVKDKSVRNYPELYGMAVLTFDANGKFISSNPDGIKGLNNLDKDGREIKK